MGMLGGELICLYLLLLSWNYEELAHEHDRGVVLCKVTNLIKGDSSPRYLCTISFK